MDEMETDNYAPSTTGICKVAECPKHSAKGEKYSANTFPSVTLGKNHFGEAVFVEYLVSDTRRTNIECPNQHSVNIFQKKQQKNATTTASAATTTTSAPPPHPLPPRSP
jgi:hypothetical protein